MGAELDRLSAQWRQMLARLKAQAAERRMVIVGSDDGQCIFESFDADGARTPYDLVTLRDERGNFFDCRLVGRDFDSVTLDLDTLRALPPQVSSYWHEDTVGLSNIELHALRENASNQ